MKQSGRRTLIELGMSIDLAICGASLLIASAWTSHPLWKIDAILLRHPLRELVMIIALGICWHLSLVANRAYSSYRTARWHEQALALVRGTACAALYTFVWLCMGRLNGPIAIGLMLSKVFVFSCLVFLGLLFTRTCARLIVRSLRLHGRNLRHVLIVGTNRRAVAVADSLLKERDFGYRVAGFVDETWHYSQASENYKRLLLGSSEDLPELLRTLPLDEVVVALPIASCYQTTRQVIDMCDQQGILVRWESSLYEVKSRTATERQAHPQLVTVNGDSRGEWTLAGKRMVDLLVAVAALLVLVPVLAVVALGIKLTSPGPIIFSQERIGIGKRRFRIFKFRTMVVDAEAHIVSLAHLNQSEGPTFKLRQDPRITPIGKFLRKTSLDELPQLVNVLLGDMSLVGPRPLPVRDYQGFSEDWHRRRFSVKPGITCLWQVNGRSSTTFNRWMELDMDYIDRWSLWLDFKILFQTIPAVVRGSGAM